MAPRGLSGIPNLRGLNHAVMEIYVFKDCSSSFRRQRDYREVTGTERKSSAFRLQSASLSDLHNKSGHPGSEKSIHSIFIANLILLAERRGDNVV